MHDLTEAARRRVQEVAARHGMSAEAAAVLLRALAAGGGTAAQFSHPELGGMGQWSAGGLVMVGDMFNQGLKARVDALCNDLAALLREGAAFAAAPLRPAGQAQWQGAGGFGLAQGGWWPAELGMPAASGAQDDMAYAHFPQAGRLAVRLGGTVRLYDTGGMQVLGVSQQQGPGRSLRVSTSRGELALADLRPVEAAGPSAMPAAAPPAAPSAADPLALLEKLAELHQRGILTDDEFAAKKAELLARL